MENKYLVPNVIQYGEDGFGHQLEGIMGVLGLHFCGKINYVFNYNRRYKYQHSNIDEKCIHYMKYAIEKLLIKYPSTKEFNNRKHKHEVWKIPKNFDENVVYSIDNAFFEPTEQLVQSQEIFKEIYRKNPFLPTPSYQKNVNNEKVVVCHVRLGDAVSRQKELQIQYKVISYYQENFPDYKIIIHTNGNVPFEETNNIIIKNKNTHVLQVLSDFIHADILIIAESSLSIAATWLCDEKTEIIGPSYNSYNLKNRIRPGFISYKDVFNSKITTTTIV